MLNRAIISSQDSILDTVELQRMSLFFDHILILPIQRKKISSDESKRLYAELDFLREHDVAVKFGIETPFGGMMGFGLEDGTIWDPGADLIKDSDFKLPWKLFAATGNIPEGEDHIDRVIHFYAKRLTYNEGPITAHAAPMNLVNKDSKTNAIEIVLKKVPMPPDNIPWSDFIQFRNDEENKHKLRALRIWLQKQAVNFESPSIIKEELEHLLFEYEKYMQIQHKKFSNGVISSLLCAAPEILANLKTLNFSSVFKSLMSIQGQSLELAEAELTAPGKEVSYISKVKKMIK